MYADVIVDISAEELDRSFQYLIPEKLEGKAVPGTPVVIPFGSRRINGFIIDVSDSPKIDPARIKPLISVDEKANGIDSRMIRLAWWIKEQFGSTMNDALRTVLPVKAKVREVIVRTIVPACSEEELAEYCHEAERKKAVARYRLLKELMEQRELDWSVVTGKLNVSAATLRKAESDCVIRIQSESRYRSPLFNFKTHGAKKVDLNPMQKQICDAVINDMDNGIRKDYLIHGVTGSGKTEVYMDIIDHVVAKGKKVIMLIPEIALTYQTVKRFYSRFGDRISVMNSKLSHGERYDEYQRARRGETDIVIGPRSALFTPFDDLGLIIVDEEHEQSYRSDSSPKYNARDVALKLAEWEGASCIFGSATPSVEAYTMAKAGRLTLFEMTERAGGAQMPHVSVVDMREELKNGNRSIFSDELRMLIGDRLEKKQQTMLFLNRRGYTGSVICRSCGHTVKCPHCDISMTLHNDGMMRCHFCGHTEQKVTACPKCASPYIGSFGLGTQKVEEQIRKLFPAARVLRMDADSTKGKTGYEDILSAFANEEADILVGTQMIVKGHDFPKVTLVGIILADLSLFASDFRSSEKTFQLLAQASGRAGRGELNGNVVIQTYNPAHYSIEKASTADYKGFYDEEYAFRRSMKYPPYGSILSVMVLSKDEARADAGAGSLKQFILKCREGSGMSVIGPSEASIAKANDLYRRVVYIKCGDYSQLVRMKDMIYERYQKNRNSDILIDFSFN